MNALREQIAHERNEIIIDDPAEAGKKFSLTWEEARAQGFFRRYVILEK